MKNQDISSSRTNPFVRIEALTIPEFCAKFRIGKSLYYKLQARGEGPKTVKVGGRILIFKEAIDAWKAERLAASSASP